MPRRTTHVHHRLSAALVAALPAALLLGACSAPAGGTAASDAKPRSVAAAPATPAAPASAAAASAASLAPSRRGAATAAAASTQTPRSAADAGSGSAAGAASVGASGGASASSAGQAALAPAAAGARRVTFVNNVKQTIWLAAAPDPKHPLARTGWVLHPGHSVTISVPNHWNGRLWGRTGCVFRNGRGHCQTGDCGGKLQCTGFGAIPATLAEYDLDAWDNLDFYDVSMVDGSNLPMYINVTRGQAAKKVSKKGCIPAGCTKPVVCPHALQITSGGKVVACESACAKLGGNQYCCRGKWAPRADCNPKKWPVDYAAVFKRAEPYAYSYVDDDATSVYVCKGTCYYRIVFGVTPPH